MRIVQAQMDAEKLATGKQKNMEGWFAKLAQAIDNGRWGVASAKLDLIKTSLEGTNQNEKAKERLISLESAIKNNRWGTAAANLDLLKVALQEPQARSLPQGPIDLAPQARFERADTELKTVIGRLSGTQKEMLEEAKTRLDTATNGVLAEFNRMINYLSPDELATQWDENREIIRQKIGAAISGYVNDVNLEFEADSRQLLKEYFLAKIHIGIKDSTKVSENALIMADVNGVSESGISFGNFSDEQRVLGIFGKIYGLDAALKAAVYGSPVPAELADESGQFSIQKFQSALNGLEDGGRIALAYLYGANGEVFDKFADFMGIGEVQGEIEDKYKYVMEWMYGKRSILNGEYNRPVVTARAAGVLTDTQTVGNGNIVRGVFDAMAVAAFSRQCRENPDEDSLAVLGNLVQQVKEKNLPPYSQTMLLSTKFGNLMQGTQLLNEVDRQAIFGQVIDSFNGIYSRAPAGSRYKFLDGFTSGIGGITRENLMDTLRAQLVSTSQEGMLELNSPFFSFYRAYRVYTDFTTQQIAEAVLRLDPYANMYYNLNAMEKFGVVFPGNWNAMLGYDAGAYLHPRVSEMGWRMGVIEIANKSLVQIGVENNRMQRGGSWDAYGRTVGEHFKDTHVGGEAGAIYSDVRGDRARFSYARNEDVMRDQYLRPTDRVANETYEGEFAGTIAASSSDLLTGFLKANQTTGRTTENTVYDPVDYSAIISESDEEVMDRALLGELNRASLNGSNLAIRVDASESTTMNRSDNMEGGPPNVDQRGEKIDADVFYFATNKWYRSNTRYRVDKGTAERFLHLYNEYYQAVGKGSVLGGYERGSIVAPNNNAEGFLAGFTVENFGAVGVRTRAHNAGAIAGKHEMEGAGGDMRVKAATYVEWFDNKRQEEFQQLGQTGLPAAENQYVGGRWDRNAGSRGVSADRMEVGSFRATGVISDNALGAQYLRESAGVALSYAFNPISGTYVTESDFGANTGTLTGSGYIITATENAKTSLAQVGMGEEIAINEKEGVYLMLNVSVDNIFPRERSFGKTPDATKRIDVLRREIEVEIAKPDYYSDENAGRREEQLRDWAYRLDAIARDYARMGMADVLTGSVPLLAAATLVKRNPQTGEEVFSIGGKYTSNLPEMGLWDPTQGQGVSREKTETEELFGMVMNFNVTNRLSMFGMAPLNKINPDQIGRAPSRVVEFAGAKYELSENWTMLAIASNFNQPKEVQKPGEIDMMYRGSLGGKDFKFGMALKSFDESTRAATIEVWRGDAKNSTQITFSNVRGDDLREVGGSIEKRWGVYNTVSFALQWAETNYVKMNKQTAAIQLGNELLPGLHIESLGNQYFRFSLSRREFFGPSSSGKDWEGTVGIGVTY